MNKLAISAVMGGLFVPAMAFGQAQGTHWEDNFESRTIGSLRNQGPWINDRDDRYGSVVASNITNGGTQSARFTTVGDGANGAWTYLGFSGQTAGWDGANVSDHPRFEWDYFMKVGSRDSNHKLMIAPIVMNNDPALITIMPSLITDGEWLSYNTTLGAATPGGYPYSYSPAWQTASMTPDINGNAINNDTLYLAAWGNHFPDPTDPTPSVDDATPKQTSITEVVKMPLSWDKEYLVRGSLNISSTFANTDTVTWKVYDRSNGSLVGQINTLANETARQTKFWAGTDPLGGSYRLNNMWFKSQGYGTDVPDGIYVDRWQFRALGKATKDTDANLDYITDIDDALILLGNFNKTSGMFMTDGDATNDGAVDIDDALEMLGNFNVASDAAAAGTAHAHYDPATGHVYLDAKGVSGYSLKSASPGFLTGATPLWSTAGTSRTDTDLKIGEASFSGNLNDLTSYDLGAVAATNIAAGNLTFTYSVTGLGTFSSAVQYMAVPEPAALSLLAIGSLGLLARRRRAA